MPTQAWEVNWTIAKVISKQIADCGVRYFVVVYTTLLWTHLCFFWRLHSHWLCLRDQECFELHILEKESFSDESFRRFAASSEFAAGEVAPDGKHPETPSFRYVWQHCLSRSCLKHGILLLRFGRRLLSPFPVKRISPYWFVDKPNRVVFGFRFFCEAFRGT